MALKYSEKDVSQWSTNDFIAYLCEKHLAVYGTEYTPPGRNWSLERGLIGSLIGTKGRQPKPRKYEPEVVRAFIDSCFASHKCTAQWPGVTFSFFWKYKTAIWQKVYAESLKAEKRRSQATVQTEQKDEDILDWL